MTITTFNGVGYLICVTKLDDSFWGGGGVQLYPSVEKLGLISNSIYSVVYLGVCSLNLYTQLYVCKYRLHLIANRLIAKFVLLQKKLKHRSFYHSFNVKTPC